jgi:hypothetical protein
MQYAKFIDDDTTLANALKLSNNVPIEREYEEKIDPNQYVGWQTITEWNPLTTKLFSRKTVNVIKEKVSEYLIGVDPKGRKIIPSDRVVVTALYGVFYNHVPQTGDIYGKYLVVDQTLRDDYAYIVDKTISMLVQGIRSDLGMQEENEKLTIWTTVLGDFNEHGLRQYPPIKIRNKRPDPMLFHMKY